MRGTTITLSYLKNCSSYRFSLICLKVIEHFLTSFDWNYKQYTIYNIHVFSSCRLTFVFYVCLSVFLFDLVSQKNVSSVIACRECQKFFSKHVWLLPRQQSNWKICWHPRHYTSNLQLYKIVTSRKFNLVAQPSFCSISRPRSFTIFFLNYNFLFLFKFGLHFLKLKLNTKLVVDLFR